MSELEVWNELGNIYYNTGAYDESVRAYTKAIEMDQGCERSYSNVASIYVSQGRLVEAISLLQKGILHLKEPKEKALLWNQLGDLRRQMGDGESASAAYCKAIELDPDNVVFQDSLAKVSLPISKSESANQKTVVEVMEAESDDASDATPELLDAQASGTDPVEASIDEESPKADQAMSTQAESEAEAPSFDEQMATDDSSKARAAALLKIGLLHWRKMDYEQSAKFLNAARDLAAGFHDDHFEALCLNAIARVETDLGRIAEAIQAYEQVASLDPDYFLPWNKLGLLYSQIGEYEKALTAFRKAIEYTPKDASSWNGLGDIYHKLGRSEDAIAAYQLGNVLDKQVRNENSVTADRLTREAEPQGPHIWMEMGTIYYDAGSYEEAIDAYSKAVESLDDEADQALLWSRLGDAHQKLGHHEEAASAYQKAAVLDPVNAASRANMAEAELTAEQADEEADTQSPQALAEAGQEESAPTESEEAKFDASTDAEQADDSGADVEESERKPAFWVFNPRKSAGKPPRPSMRPRIAFPTTAQPAPALAMPRLIDQAFLGERVLLDAHDEANVMVVDSEAPAGPALEAKTETSEESDTKPIKIEALGLHPANQLEKKLRSVENDIAAYRRVTEINPKNDRAWDALGNMYEAAGLHSEAIAAFEQAISLDAKKEAYHYHLGLAHAAQTHYEDAIQSLLKVVELNPSYILAHCALAGYYRRVGKETKAQKHVAIARPIMENENEYNRACFESICGNTDRAFELLDVALDKQQIQLDWVRNDPDLDFVRSDSRFDALLQKYGVHAD